MGFLDFFFSNAINDPPEYAWDDLIQSIHNKLAAEGRDWFALCVEILSMLQEAKIKNDSMSDRINLAITVYQLHIAGILITRRRYFCMEVEQKKFVANMLRAGLQGYESELSEFSCRYFPYPDDGTNIEAFPYDISKYITGNSHKPRFTQLIFSSLPLFHNSCNHAIAEVFQDAKAIRKLSRERQNLPFFKFKQEW